MFAHAKPEQKQDAKSTVQKKESAEMPAYLNRTGIPDDIRTRFGTLSGLSFNDAHVHYNSDKPIQLQALAYIKQKQQTDESVIQLRSSTFYGNYFKSTSGTPKQGPHTVAHAAINASINSLNYNDLKAYFRNNIKTVAQVRDILEAGGENIYESDAYGYDNTNRENATLDSYLDNYENDYSAVEDGIKEIDRFDLNTPDGRVDFSNTFPALQDNIKRLINANPYATYAWNLPDGATAAHLAGNHERAVNFFSFTTAAQVIASNCLDNSFLEATTATFSSLAGITDYLQSLFINLPPAQINILVPALPAAI